MEENILDNIKNVDMEKVCILFQIKISIWGCGKMINLIMMVFIFIVMERSTMENFLKVKKMEGVSIIIRVDLFMMDSGIKIEKMDLEHMFM